MTVQNRPYRLANIAAIAVALAVAVACTYWRERFGANPIASNGGVVALSLLLVLQTFYDNQVEVAFANLHGRVDVQERRIDRLERERDRRA